MGLLDRFKPQPRWKHADAAIRLEAVRDLDDGIELEALAESDPDPKVRRAAVAQTADPACLGRIASNDTDPDIRERAADRLLALASQDAPPVPAAEGGLAEGDRDAQALAAYLKSLKPIRNKAPAITGPGQKPPAPFLRIVAPE
jgi:hypothetical protein